MAHLEDNLFLDYLNRNSKALMALSNILIFITAVVGIILVNSELQELRQQNSFTLTGLKQTYRPIGVVMSDTSTDLFILHYMKSDNKDKYGFGFSYFLANKGQGVLSYLGRFSFLSTDTIDFRDSFLKGMFDSLNVDELHSNMRGHNIIPFEKDKFEFIQIPINFEDIKFEDTYYIYSLFLYEDQYGNLYDTEVIYSIPFLKPFVQDDQLTTTIDKNAGYEEKITYNYYDESDRIKLIEVIRNLKHPQNHNILSDIISE